MGSNPLSLLNRLSTDTKEDTTHRDLLPSQRAKDEKTVSMVKQWFDEMEPFDVTRDKDILISFSTGFFSKNDDINPEKTYEVGNEIQQKLDGHVPTAKLEKKKLKVVPLSNLRKNVINSQAAPQIDAFKYFNRLVIFAQREDDLESAFMYELGPLPMSLFSSKDQLMHEANKASFAHTVLKEKVDISDVRNSNVEQLVVDGGWFLHQVGWEKLATWHDIISSYIQFAHCIGNHASHVEIIFDGYKLSTKDHTHRRRQ